MGTSVFGSGLLLVLMPVTSGVVVGIVFIFILLFCSAAVSGSEMAYFSIDRKLLDEIRTRYPADAERIERLTGKPQKLLATILISNNFVNVAMVIIATYVTAHLFDLAHSPVLAFVIEVFVLTSLILLFGELVPKIYSNQYPVKFAIMMSRPMTFLMRFFSPLSYLMIKPTGKIEQRLARKKENLSMDELSDAIDITSNEKTHAQDKSILKGIVKFSDTEVKEIMKPRIDVFAINIDSSVENVMQMVRNSGFSRIPVYEKTFDHVVGILHIKDLLPFVKNDQPGDWKDAIRQAFFIPENKKINDLLTEFKEKKIHLAVVVDEYGGTSGIVTLEDVIEEIVGDISDEFDEESDHVFFRKINENTYLFEGKTSLSDFYRITGVKSTLFDEIKGESESLAGVVLEITGKIPMKNEFVQWRNIVFKIESADNRKIKQLKVTINPEENESP